FFYSHALPLHLHSFPTRRSSDLDYWLSFNNAPHSLYNFVMEENIKLLDERADQLSDIHHINQWKKRQKWIKHTLNEMIGPFPEKDRKSTRLNSSHVKISYAVFCL